MTVNEFKAMAEHYVNGLHDLIDTLPQKGNTEEECHKCYLLNALGKFEQALVGVEEIDLIKN